MRLKYLPDESEFWNFVKKAMDCDRCKFSPSCGKTPTTMPCRELDSIYFKAHRKTLRAKSTAKYMNEGRS